jgi:hypothetical protein
LFVYLVATIWKMTQNVLCFCKVSEYCSVIVLQSQKVWSWLCHVLWSSTHWKQRNSHNKKHHQTFPVVLLSSRRNQIISILFVKQNSFCRIFFSHQRALFGPCSLLAAIEKNLYLVLQYQKDINQLFQNPFAPCLHWREFQSSCLSRSLEGGVLCVGYIWKEASVVVSIFFWGRSWRSSADNKEQTKWSWTM